VKGELPVRKHIRLKYYDYSNAGYYHITICSKGMHKLFGKVVGGDAYIAPPNVVYSTYGHIAEKYVNNINTSYANVCVDKFVIMPNHIHMIIVLEEDKVRKTGIPSVVRSLKVLVTKEIGVSIWQRGYHERVLRNEAEYLERWQYIDNNPAKWLEDEYYVD